jgi:hypothetical protein
MGGALRRAPPCCTAAPAEEPIEARLENSRACSTRSDLAADYDSAKAELLKKLIG